MHLNSLAMYDLPADLAFSVLSDFDALEGLAGAYGAEVLGRKAGGPDGVGRAWEMAIAFKGMRRGVDAHVAEVRTNDRFVISADSEGVLLDVTVRVRPVSHTRCEVCFDADVSSRSLAGRLLLQPLKFAQATLNRKFHDRVTGYTQRRLTALGTS